MWSMLTVQVLLSLLKSHFWGENSLFQTIYHISGWQCYQHVFQKIIWNYFEFFTKEVEFTFAISDTQRLYRITYYKVLLHFCTNVKYFHVIYWIFKIKSLFCSPLIFFNDAYIFFNDVTFNIVHIESVWLIPECFNIFCFVCYQTNPIYITQTGK